MVVLASICVLILFYYLINFVLWCLLDSDIELFLKSLIGKKIASLSGKVVWIIGASSGIGKQLALVLAANGVKLVLSARRNDELEKVKLECLEIAAGKLSLSDILVLEMNVVHTTKHKSAFSKVISHFNRLDILVNNVGRAQRASWQKIHCEIDEKIFNLNVFAAVNLSRIIVDYFLTNEIKGHVAVTSSVAGLLPVPESASYTAAKHALHGYFESLKVEQSQLAVTIFCPGPTITDFLEKCLTGQKGEKLTQSGTSVKRMTGERCGELYAIALANRTFISWVGRFPISFLIYLCRAFPNLQIFFMKIFKYYTM